MKDENADGTLNMQFDNVKTTTGNYTKARPKVEKSCGVIVYRDCEDGREFLLLKYPEGHWDLPKGHVEDGETEEETAHREFTEETGIEELEILEGFREPLTYKFFANFSNLRGWIQKTVVFFVGKTHSCAVTTLSHEHNDFQWLSEEEVLKKITYDNAREILSKALNFVNSQV